MKILIFDTETTGLPNNKHDRLCPINQPHIIQLGAVLIDYESSSILHKINTLVIPHPKAVFNAKAMEVNKIDIDTIYTLGRETLPVMRELRDVVRQADVVGAYNLQFDKRLVDTCSERLSDEFIDAPVLGDGVTPMQHCVMDQTTNFFGFRHKLGSVYQKLFDKEIEGAHDAFIDALAAAEIMIELTKRTIEKT
jgi:DNA polymerase III alpha subunit (gram-positive type)